MVSAMENPLVLGSVDTRTYLIGENLCRHQFEMFDHIEHSWSQRTPPPLPPSSQGTMMTLSTHAIVRSDIVVSILGLGVHSYHTTSDSILGYSRFFRPGEKCVPVQRLRATLRREVVCFGCRFKGLSFVFLPGSTCQVFGRGERVNVVWPLQPAALDSQKALLFERTGQILPMGSDLLCVVCAGYDGVQMGMCFPSHRVGITRFQLESSGKGKQLSAINQHMAMYNLSGFSSSLPTIRGCFTL